jgi:hypothetical protein
MAELNAPQKGDGSMTPEAEARAYSREAEAIAALKRSGFTGEFVVEDGRLRLSGTDRRFAARELRIRKHVRFEGTSDPDDMSVIYAIEARDGTRGILVDAFGTYADPAVGALVDQIRTATVKRTRVAAVAAGAVIAGVIGWALIRLVRGMGPRAHPAAGGLSWISDRLRSGTG